jgi:hypothetical protein
MFFGETLHPAHDHAGDVVMLAHRADEGVHGRHS